MMEILGTAMNIAKMIYEQAQLAKKNNQYHFFIIIFIYLLKENLTCEETKQKLYP